MTEIKKESKYKPRIRYMTEKDFDKKFPDEKAAVDYFIKIRYGETVLCRHCKEPVKYRYKGQIKLFHCYRCHNSFSPFKDTIFGKTHIGLLTWFSAIRHMINNRKGISSCTLERELGVSTVTAWRISQQIKLAMGNHDVPNFAGIIEMDETFIGGKPRGQNAWVKNDGTKVPRKYPKKNKRGLGTEKTPIAGMKERSTGKVYAKVMLNTEGEKLLTFDDLMELLKKVITENNIIMTDGYSSYESLYKLYEHYSVIHSKGEYVNYENPAIHTNGIENFWSILKRGHYGTFHQISKKYLQRYVDEFTFRQSTYKDLSTFDIVLKQCILHNPKIITDTILNIKKPEGKE